MEELRKEIPGYEGIYQISNLGLVRKIYKKNRRIIIGKEKCFYHFTRKDGTKGVNKSYKNKYEIKENIRYKNIKGRIVKYNNKGQPYLSVSLRNKDKNNVYLMHRLVASTYLGEIEGKVVMHLDDNPSNNCVINLKIGTQKENIIYSSKKNRMKKKLSDDQIIEIRKLISIGGSDRLIGRLYNVSGTSIFKIRHNKLRSTDI